MAEPKWEDQKERAKVVGRSLPAKFNTAGKRCAPDQNSPTRLSNGQSNSVPGANINSSKGGSLP